MTGVFKVRSVLKGRGFTLVELMIVVLILGALAVIAIPRIMGGASTAKANSCRTNIDLINKQIELYYANTGSYPNNLTTITQDPAYFPDGEPICPITETVYPNGVPGGRLNDAGHAH